MTNLLHLHDYGKGSLYIASNLPDLQTINEKKIDTIIDMDGSKNTVAPQIVNECLYISYPISDGTVLPDLRKLHAVARLAARFLRNGQRVLSRCSMGQNRCALVAGVTLTYLGMNGKEIVDLIQQKRQDALYNKVFADYLASLLSVPLL